MRASGRSIVFGALIVLCAGFGPAGGCARACSSGCRGGSKVAGRSASHADDLVRYSPRYTPPRPMVVPGAGLGGELGHAGAASLDDAVRALPEVEGSVASLARAPSPRGLSVDTSSAARSFGRDYGRSVERLGLSNDQHGRLVDAFDAVQKLIGQLAGLDEPSDEAGRRFNDRIRQARTTRAAAELDVALYDILTPEQRYRLIALLGTPEVMVHRIGSELPVQRAPSPAH